MSCCSKKNVVAQKINSCEFQTFEYIDGGRRPRTDILKGLFRHIYIENGQIKCFHFYSSGWGLRVIYNLDIFKNLDPPIVNQRLLSNRSNKQFLISSFLGSPCTMPRNLKKVYIWWWWLFCIHDNISELMFVIGWQNNLSCNLIMFVFWKITFKS